MVRFFLVVLNPDFIKRSRLAYVFLIVEEHMALFKKKGLYLIAVVIFMMAFGCDSPGKKTSEKIETFDLAFVDGSNGLPSTGEWRQNLSFYDMNGDGHLDILASPRRLAPTGEAKPAVWYGNGKGEWSKTTFLDISPEFVGNYGSIAASDFNNDGIPDVALAMHGLGLRAIKGLGNNKYADFSQGLLPYADFPTRGLISADFNNDGKADIVAVSEYVPDKSMFSYGGLVKCFFENGGWQCQRIGDLKETGGLLADQLAAGDVNGDGNVDIAVATRNHMRDLIIWLGDGKGKFSPFNKGLLQKKHYMTVSLADVNGDGRDDLIACISGIGKATVKGLKVFLSHPDGFLDQSKGFPTGEAWHYFATGGDMDGDGIAEVIAATKEGGLEVYQQKGEQWEKMRVEGLPEKGLYRIYGLYAVDVNKDGRNDIVVIHGNATEKTGGIQVFLGESVSK